MGKSIRTELLCMKNSLLDGQISHAKLSSQLLNLPGAQPLMKPLQIAGKPISTNSIFFCGASHWTTVTDLIETSVQIKSEEMITTTRMFSCCVDLKKILPFYFNHFLGTGWERYLKLNVFWNASCYPIYDIKYTVISIVRYPTVYV